ncbi:MAG: carbohydrate ABC transporter permease [Sphaerochaetaceae bacterium]|nr:carbohydrate ABC transporter permease [Sphaerochaetaceae bacterium]MDC7236268.1 carbohydrate ABC transporter permease [Sphaerochaetaceae bacterium]MDC7250288.1 carbohydrate ABC transporter permease [Sphaerochaetaceae bacterium]
MNTNLKLKTPTSNYRKGLRANRILCYFVLIFLCLVCLFPFFILIINSSRLNSEIQKGFSLLPSQYFFRNAKNLFSDQNIPILRGLINSVYISTLASILAVYVSSMTAFGIYMYNFKLKKFAFSFVLLVMMVPVQISALGFLKLMIRFGLMDTFYPLIVPAAAAPVVIFFMIQYMQSVLPFEIVEAARVDGSNEFYTFNKIVLPILKPAIALQMIFSFVGSWNNYFMPALIINSKDKKTIPILIAQLRGADYMKFDYGKVYMLICVAILPLLIIYLFLSRFIIQGVTLGSVKG